MKVNKLTIALLLFSSFHNSSCLMGTKKSNCTSNIMCNAVQIANLEGCLAQSTALDKLLSEGFLINNQVDEDGNTLLHKAVCREDIELIKILLDRGALIDKKNSLGLRPLDYAISKTNMLEMLMSKGSTQEIILDGVPVYIWETVLFDFKNDKPTLLYINGKRASQQLLEWLHVRGQLFIVSDYVGSGKIEFMSEGPPLREDVFYLYEILCKKESDSKIIVETLLSLSTDKKYINESMSKYVMVNHNKIEFERIHGYWFSKYVFSRGQ